MQIDLVPGQRSRSSGQGAPPESASTMPGMAGDASTPRFASREARRQQLIEATIASIAELGLNDTTLATVTRRAGLSHGTVNFHFRSKDRLLAETLRYLAEDHRGRWRAAAAGAGARPEAQLAAMLAVDFHLEVSNDTRLSVWFAIWGELKWRPLYAEICGQMDAERLETLGNLCRRIAEDGRYNGVDPVVVAQGLQALIDGLWLNMLCQPVGFREGQAPAICRAYLSGVFPSHFPAAEQVSQE